MAHRYSGAVHITVKWSDEKQNYVCHVIAPDGSAAVEVEPSPELQRRLAVDSPEAHDEIAKAALSFAEEELEAKGVSLAESALFEPDGSGWVVARKKDHDVVFG